MEVLCRCGDRWRLCAGVETDGGFVQAWRQMEVLCRCADRCKLRRWLSQFLLCPLPLDSLPATNQVECFIDEVDNGSHSCVPGSSQVLCVQCICSPMPKSWDFFKTA